MKNLLSIIILLSFFTSAPAQDINYPFTSQSISLNIENQIVKMSYMDAKPIQPNGQTVVLLHGKNFNGYYWKEVISFLNNNGYRVIVPDQVGWGKSDKPNIHYSFHLLAANTKKLLDSLAVKEVTIVGHSMGGMLAARFTLLYPQMVKKLIFENPIGLEDYKTFIPYQPIEATYTKELKANYDSLKKYQQSYYPVWKPEYDQYVTAQYQALQFPSFKEAILASALSYQMIYEQPVLYEFKKITQPALIILGQTDRTVVGKNLLSKEEAAKHGNYPALGKWLKEEIKNSTLIELEGVGHIPHIQTPDIFKTHVLKFLNN